MRREPFTDPKPAQERARLPYQPSSGHQLAERTTRNLGIKRHVSCPSSRAQAGLPRVQWRVRVRIPRRIPLLACGWK